MKFTTKLKNRPQNQTLRIDVATIGYRYEYVLYNWMPLHYSSLF